MHRNWNARHKARSRTFAGTFCMTRDIVHTRRQASIPMHGIWVDVAAGTMTRGDLADERLSQSVDDRGRQVVVEDVAGHGREARRVGVTAPKLPITSRSDRSGPVSTSMSGAT
jgi:hypothetical protein